MPRAVATRLVAELLPAEPKRKRPLPLPLTSGLPLRLSEPCDKSSDRDDYCNYSCDYDCDGDCGDYCGD